MAKNSIAPIPLTSIDSATFTGAYQLVSGAGGLTNACFLIRIINNSTKDVTISYNGTNDHDFVPAGKEVQLQFQTNKSPQGYAALIAQGTKIYVKGAAGVGLVYLSGYFSPVGG
jgi:hypothetical protein